MPVPAKILLVVLTHIGGPFMTTSAPELRPEPLADKRASSRLASLPDDPTSGPEIAISIADNVREVSHGQRIRYHIRVKNPTTAQTTVTVRLTLPPAAISRIEADGATVIANAVAWKRAIGPGETWTHTVTGTVKRAASTRDIEALACLHLPTGHPAVTCAADRNTVATSTIMDRYAWPAAILFGILTVIGALWLHRKINPEPLTAANAAPPADDTPGLPGGTPSA